MKIIYSGLVLVLCSLISCQYHEKQSGNTFESVPNQINHQNQLHEQVRKVSKAVDAAERRIKTGQQTTETVVYMHNNQEKKMKLIKSGENVLLHGLEEYIEIYVPKLKAAYERMKTNSFAQPNYYELIVLTKFSEYFLKIRKITGISEQRISVPTIVTRLAWELTNLSDLINNKLNNHLGDQEVFIEEALGSWQDYEFATHRDSNGNDLGIAALIWMLNSKAEVGVKKNPVDGLVFKEDVKEFYKRQTNYMHSMLRFILNAQNNTLNGDQNKIWQAFKKLDLESRSYVETRNFEEVAERLLEMNQLLTKIWKTSKAEPKK